MAEGSRRGLPQDREAFVAAFSDEELHKLVLMLGSHPAVNSRVGYLQNFGSRTDEELRNKIRQRIRSSAGSATFDRCVLVLKSLGVTPPVPGENQVAWINGYLDELKTEISQYKPVEVAVPMPTAQQSVRATLRENREELKRQSFERLKKDLLEPPEGLILLENRAVGKVKLTHHAWERFIDRLPVAIRLKQPIFYHSKKWILEKLQSMFLSSTASRLEPKYQVRRLMRNRLHPVIYLMEPDRKLRFVVSRDAKPSLITCELARENSDLRPR